MYFHCQDAIPMQSSWKSPLDTICILWKPTILYMYFSNKYEFETFLVVKFKQGRRFGKLLLRTIACWQNWWFLCGFREIDGIELTFVTGCVVETDTFVLLHKKQMSTLNLTKMANENESNYLPLLRRFFLQDVSRK